MLSTKNNYIKDNVKPFIISLIFCFGIAISYTLFQYFYVKPSTGQVVEVSFLSFLSKYLFIALIISIPLSLLVSFWLKNKETIMATQREDFKMFASLALLLKLKLFVMLFVAVVCGLFIGAILGAIFGIILNEDIWLVYLTAEYGAVILGIIAPLITYHKILTNITVSSSSS